MDISTVLALCRLLQSKPQGAALGEVYHRLDPLWVDKALEMLVRAGLVEARDGLLLSRPGLGKLTRSLELVFAHVTQAEETEALVGLVGMLLTQKESG